MEVVIIQLHRGMIISVEYTLHISVIAVDAVELRRARYAYLFSDSLENRHLETP